MKAVHVNAPGIPLIAATEKIRSGFRQRDGRAGRTSSVEFSHQARTTALVPGNCIHGQRTGAYDGTSPFDRTSCHNCILRARKPPADPSR